MREQHVKGDASATHSRDEIVAFPPKVVRMYTHAG